MTVHIDDDPGKAFTMAGVYADTSVNRVVYVGEDFNGVIRYVKVFSDFNKCTTFIKNSTDLKYYEHYRF